MITARHLVGHGLALTLAVGLGFPPATFGQAAKGKKPAGGEVEIEEITVTAEKRAESIQEIPLSVTALSAETLQQRGVTNVVALGETAPNLAIRETPSTPSGTTISMRGLAQGNPNPVFQPRVGLYVDGMYIAKIQGSNLDLDDLERVEVLRGPQGTLYGRNTIGGAVDFVTKKPSEEREITVATRAGNFDQFTGRLMFNAPLIGKNGFFQSDVLGTLSIRENVGYKHHDGFYRNVSPTNLRASGGSDFNDLNRVFSTTSVRWQPTKDITLDYAFEYHRYRDQNSSFQTTYIYPQSAAQQFGMSSYVRTNRVDAIGNNALCTFYVDSASSRLANNPCDGRNADDGNDRMHTLAGAWDLGNVGMLGNVTLKSIAGYRDFFNQSDSDLDGTPIHVGDFAATYPTKHWSEELQLLGTAPRLHYVLGFYYYGEHADLRQSTQLFSGSVNVPYNSSTQAESYAPYGQLSYTPPIFGDKITVTGGIRYTKEQVHTDQTFRCARITSDGVNICNQSFLPVAQFPQLHDWSQGRGKAFGGWDAVSPMGNVAAQWTDNVMTYFRVARGYQSGGFNGTTTDPRVFAIPFDPETLLQYEAGFKSQFFGNRLRLNASGFYSDYKNMQVSVFRATPEGGANSIISNAASAEIWGMEFEGAAIPFRGVEATVSYSFLSPKYKEWLDTQVDANGSPVFDASGKPVLIDVAKQRSFPFSPQNTATVGLTYTAPPTTTGVFSAHADVYWQDLTTFITNNQTPGAQADEGWAYALVNGRLAYTGIPLQQGSLDVAVFGRNLFDRKYRTHGIDFGSSLGWSGNNYGAPRTFGLELTYNFTAGKAAPPPPAPVAQAAPPAPPPAKKKIVLRSVHFDFDKATLKAEAKPILDEAVQVLKQEGSVDIVVEGHTDSVGTDAYNLGLSRRRAETVRGYLVEHGIARSRITADGMGESKPVASNDTADGRAQNRRVELHVK